VGGKRVTKKKETEEKESIEDNGIWVNKKNIEANEWEKKRFLNLFIVLYMEASGSQKGASIRRTFRCPL